jgi:hypothetical protein
VLVEIRGTDLPGRQCAPTPQGEVYENIHVGIGRGDSLTGLVPGDALSASWQIDVKTRFDPRETLTSEGPLSKAHAERASST